jgi:hypothetical protein
MRKFKNYLEFLVEVADRARDVDSAWDAALAVLDALDDARRLEHLGQSVDFVVSITFLRSPVFAIFGHGSGDSPCGVVSARIYRDAPAMNDRFSGSLLRRTASTARP